MAKTKTKKPKIYRDRYFEEALNKLKNNERIVYRRAALYPCLEVQVRFIEKAREQSKDELVMTILRLAGLFENGVSAEKLASLMGFNSVQNIAKITAQMAANGWIEADEKRIKLTPLGRECAQSGSQLIATSGAVLVCGITGELIPHAMTAARHFGPSDLGSQVFNYQILNESSEPIPLNALDIEELGIKKRDYGIKDEVIRIEPAPVEPLYTQRFLEASVSVSSDSMGTPGGTQISIAGIPVSWRTGDRYKNAASAVLSDFERHFAPLGEVRASERRFGAISCVVIEVVRPSAGFYRLQTQSGDAILGFVGSFERVGRSPIGLSGLPFKKGYGIDNFDPKTAPKAVSDAYKILEDEAKERLIFVISRDSEVLLASEIYRKMVQAKADFYKMPKNGRGEFDEYLEGVLAGLDEANETAVLRARSALPSWFMGMLGRKNA